MGLYENVKEQCDAKGKRVAALEDELEFPRSSICKWNENIPSIAKVQKVADALGVTVDALIKGVEFPARSRKDH